MISIAPFAAAKYIVESQHMSFFCSSVDEAEVQYHLIAKTGEAVNWRTLTTVELVAVHNAELHQREAERLASKISRALQTGRDNWRIASWADQLKYVVEQLEMHKKMAGYNPL